LVLQPAARPSTITATAMSAPRDPRARANLANEPLFECGATTDTTRPSALVCEMPQRSGTFAPHPEGAAGTVRTTAYHRAAMTARIDEGRQRLSGAATAAATAAARWGRDTARRTPELARKVQQGTKEVLASVPPEARSELRKSLWRLRKVRSPQSAARAFEEETHTLLALVTPILVEHPLPIRRTGTARAVAATGAAMAATGEQLEAIVAIFSDGVAVPATLPIALAAMFLSLVIELYATLSIRVHALRGAGATVDPQAVAAEVAWAMAGAGGRPGRAGFTRKMVTRLSTRMLARWGRGLVPVAGAAYSGWDAQRSVAAIATLPVPAPPQRVQRVAGVLEQAPAVSGPAVSGPPASGQ
jgi:hypothetical protein